MTDIRWEEPAQDGRVRFNWSEIFVELRKRPGVWALIFEDAPASTATNLKKGIYADSKPGEFEAVRRDIKNGRGKIYARYVGDGNDPA